MNLERDKGKLNEGIFLEDMQRGTDGPQTPTPKQQILTVAYIYFTLMTLWQN